MEVALLIDASESTSRRFHQELTSVVQLIGQANGVPEESFSVLSFRDVKAKVLCEGNCRSLDLGAQFPASAGGLTPLYDSIVFAAGKLGEHRDVHTRKILVVYSDGADTISLKSLSEAVESSLANDVAIYTVDVSATPHVFQGTRVLHGLAANTGGRYFTGESGAATVLDAILADFHATYTVAYKLPIYTAGFHQIRILPTRDPNLQFHCRRGYNYPEN